MSLCNLLYKFESSRIAANARKIVEYDRKHPMAACMLTVRECQVMADAVAMAKQEMECMT